jgi:hypothetical protein
MYTIEIKVPVIKEFAKQNVGLQRTRVVATKNP